MAQSVPAPFLETFWGQQHGKKMPLSGQYVVGRGLLAWYNRLSVQNLPPRKTE